ncbi:hypothetical protein FGO68_gene9475 [Halteria grandinella]|uniref:Uncharacterized protein n=1 Tax=Halteria grandinella TaxID=5974 RepID=A0A8J8NN35_HALGN|nr:hypothetical protein FGO68_gene9475 [Halteria grandinella]
MLKNNGNKIRMIDAFFQHQAPLDFYDNAEDYPFNFTIKPYEQMIAFKQLIREHRVKIKESNSLERLPFIKRNLQIVVDSKKQAPLLGDGQITTALKNNKILKAFVPSQTKKLLSNETLSSMPSESAPSSNADVIGNTMTLSPAHIQSKVFTINARTKPSRNFPSMLTGGLSNFIAKDGLTSLRKQEILSAYNIQTRNIGDNYVTLLQIQPSTSTIKAKVNRHSVETKKVVTDYELMDQGALEGLKARKKRNKSKRRNVGQGNQTVILTSAEDPSTDILGGDDFDDSHCNEFSLKDSPRLKDYKVRSTIGQVLPKIIKERSNDKEITRNTITMNIGKMNMMGVTRQNKFIHYTQGANANTSLNRSIELQNSRIDSIFPAGVKIKKRRLRLADVSLPSLKKDGRNLCDASLQPKRMMALTEQEEAIVKKIRALKLSRVVV